MIRHENSGKVGILTHINVWDSTAQGFNYSSLYSNKMDKIANIYRPLGTYQALSLF